MSRDFIGSLEGRNFQQSPNRDRITRGASPITDHYSFVGFAVPEPASTGLPEGVPFQPPEYAGNNTTPPIFLYNSAVSGTSLPIDIFPDLITTQYEIGDRLRLTFLVTGIFEAYPIESDSPIQSGSGTIIGGNGQPFAVDFQYIDRAPAFTVSLSNAAFDAQVDAFDDPREDFGPNQFQPWTTEFQGNSHVINLAAGNGSVNSVTADLTITRAGLFQDFTMSGRYKRVARLFSPGTTPPADWSLSVGIGAFHRRNLANINATNLLVPDFNCIPFGPASGAGGFPINYFQSGLVFRVQSDCQWCWAKLVNIVRLN